MVKIRPICMQKPINNTKPYPYVSVKNNPIIAWLNDENAIIHKCNLSNLIFVAKLPFK